MNQTELSKIGALMRAGRWDEAAGLLARLRHRHHDDPEFRRLTGVVEHKRGRDQAAVTSLESALHRHPDKALVHSNLGSVLRRLGDPENAAGHFERALSLKPDMEPAWYNLGLLRQQQARPGAARECFETALGYHPRRVGAWLCLGHARKALGDIDGAAEAYRRGLELAPDSGDLWWSLANIKTVSFTPSEIERMRSVLARETVARSQPGLHFALAKALEDAGDYAAAFEHYRAGNSLQRRRVRYDPAAKRELGRRIRQAFDGGFMAGHADAGHPSDAPIFIVSLPRSGSTLVEQILSSHSAVTGASELPDLGEVALSVLGDGPDGSWAPERVRELDASRLRELGAEYLRRTERWQQTPHFTDKMPNNFPLVGLIGLILPRARIIDVRRDPRDTGLSCYRQLFNRGHNWSYDLSDIAAHYRYYRALMGYWHRVMPERVLEVRYESLLEDLQGQVWRLLDFCGLAREDACLDFSRNTRAVRTASAAQVRQGLNRDAVARWRRYGSAISPLLDLADED